MRGARCGPPLHSRGPIVFLYGILQEGGRGHAELGLDRRARFIRPATVAGRLYDLGGYPGLIPGGAGRVHGGLYRLASVSLLAGLDAYEGYDPSNLPVSDYVRTRMAVLGSRLATWTYAWNRSIAGRRRIVHGDWRRHLLERRSRALLTEAPSPHRPPS